ncbi:uncharacterized protein LOC123659810 [Melitaea cinxia]|uniref:uncharacterized protein LOC123659810 n=1 Tax=Melitaea cinxia TaxID=113334 RepID=UPI001E271E92|nr:uncharacterized protein LOC123659810 [Melitaea cinxia]
MRHAATQTRAGVCRIHFHLRHLIVSRRSRCSGHRSVRRTCDAAGDTAAADRLGESIGLALVFLDSFLPRLSSPLHTVRAERRYKEMPGTNTFQVKCEPLSDEEENGTLYSKTFFSDQLTSDYVPIKLEPAPRSDENVSSNLLHHLQTTVLLRYLWGLGLETCHYPYKIMVHTSHVSQQCVQGSLEEPPAPAAPSATPVCEHAPAPYEASLATLQPAQADIGSSLISRHLEMMNTNELADSAEFVPLMSIKDEPTSEGEQPHLSSDDTSDSNGPPHETVCRGSPKSWTQKDMDQALEALRKHHMSLTKASSRFGIPSTTLWQRAHRLGIDTPKKDGGAKSWGASDLARALAALRSGTLSANKASKAYGIPSSTLYKIARREGIRLAAPFNAAPTAWRRADLTRALAAIRCGAASVQRAAAQFGIPTGTLYGRCKREGIELSRSNPTPWSEDAMEEALEAVRVGQMSINQAAIHFNLPYSSLYGRFKRCKFPPVQGQPIQQELPPPEESHPHMYYQHTHPEREHVYMSEEHTHAYAHLPYTHCHVTS